MLVLSRKPGETIVIRDDIEILVTRIDRDEVRIKIKAPRELAVFKGELYREIQLLIGDKSADAQAAFEGGGLLP